MITAFGDKNPINIDRGFGFIRHLQVTDAAHNGHRLPRLLIRCLDSRVYAATAYRSATEPQRRVNLTLATTSPWLRRPASAIQCR